MGHHLVYIDNIFKTFGDTPIPTIPTIHGFAARHSSMEFEQIPKRPDCPARSQGQNAAAQLPAQCGKIGEQGSQEHSMLPKIATVVAIY